MAGGSAEGDHKRTRTILWMLAGAKPDMPLVEALGYLKAVEAELAMREARDREAERTTAAAYRGAMGAASLVRDFAAKPVIVKLAQQGKTSAVATALQKETGCPAGTALQAATTLVNMMDESSGMSPF